MCFDNYRWHRSLVKETLFNVNFDPLTISRIQWNLLHVKIDFCSNVLRIKCCFFCLWKETCSWFTLWLSACDMLILQHRVMFLCYNKLFVMLHLTNCFAANKWMKARDSCDRSHYDTPHCFTVCFIMFTVKLSMSCASSFMQSLIYILYNRILFS